MVRFVWAGENAAITLGCAPKADQTSNPRPPWRGGLGTLSNEPWSGLFVVRNPNSNRPNCKKNFHFWTKPAAVVSCAVHYGMRKCLLTVCSVTWQFAVKLGCEEVRSFIEIWWLAMRLRRLKCINTLFSSYNCASLSKVRYCLKWYKKLCRKGWPGIKSTCAVHDSSVLSAAFDSCLCLLPGAPLEFSHTLFLTKQFRECVQRHI